MTERHVNPEDPDLYALGALDGEEKQAFEAHVRVCAACAQELDAARQRVALLGLTAPPAAPPAHVKDALLRQVRAERTAQARRAGGFAPEEKQPRSSGWGWLTPAFGVAAVVFAALAAAIWMKDVRDNRRIQELEGQLAAVHSQSAQIARAAHETDHLLGMPGTMHVVLAAQPGGPGGRAGILYNPHMGMAMCAGEIAPAPSGKSYQLWLVPMTGEPVSLGVFSAANETMTVVVHVPPGLEPRAFAVTVEPRGGMPQPTGPKVLVGAAG